MRAMKRTVLCIGVAVLAAALASESFAADRVILGVDLGLASPIGKFRNRAGDGGVFSPFVGYMFNDIIGIVGQAQGLGLPAVNPQGNRSKNTWAVAGLAGPRIALPLQLGEAPSEMYGIWEGGAFTGLEAHTPISRTSWGYSTGGGLNIGITQSLMAGAFVRYNWLDQRIGEQNVRYFTAGVGLTYNIPTSTRR